MTVQKTQIVVQKNDIHAGNPCWRLEVPKTRIGQTFCPKICSLNRDVECLSIGTIFAYSFSERSAMAVPNPIDQHVGSRVRMRRKMLSMSQEKLGAELGLSFQQVQKYVRAANRIGASRLQQNVPYPAGASRVLLRGRAERLSATRLQWKRIIDGPD